MVSQTQSLVECLAVSGNSFWGWLFFWAGKNESCSFWARGSTVYSVHSSPPTGLENVVEVWREKPSVSLCPLFSSPFSPFLSVSNLFLGLVAFCASWETLAFAFPYDRIWTERTPPLAFRPFPFLFFFSLPTLAPCLLFSSLLLNPFSGRSLLSLPPLTWHQ